MANGKMEWAIYTDPITGESNAVKYSDLNKLEYASKYRGNLTCINQCTAKIKFTEKSTGTKFFSNSSNQGGKHDCSCQFGVQYKGRMGRKKLNSYFKSLDVSKEDVKNTIKNKITTLKRKYNGEDAGKKRTYTLEIDNIGENDIEGGKVPNNPDIDENGPMKRKRIMSIDANHLTKDYIGVTKCVYGKARSAEIEFDKNEYYGYINLKNDDYNVSIYFPKAFYSQEHGIQENEFVKLFEILKKQINHDNNKNIIVCYGEIRKKKGKGVNIQVIDPDYITINEMSIKEILYSGKINTVDYDII